MEALRAAHPDDRQGFFRDFLWWFYGDFMVMYGDFMGFYGDLMGFYGGFMVILW